MSRYQDFLWKGNTKINTAYNIYYNKIDNNDNFCK